MGDAELGKRPTDLGEFLLVNLALTLAGEKVMPTTNADDGAAGRLSDGGPGHYNPDPSEDPWGCGESTSWRCTIESGGPTQCGITE